MPSGVKITPPSGSRGSQSKSTKKNAVNSRVSESGRASSRIVPSRVGGSFGPSRDERRRESRAVGIVLWLSVFICIAVSGLLLTYQSWAFFSGDKNEALVPDVINMSYRDAARAIEEAGLVLRIRTEAYSDDTEKDLIMDQLPTPGCQVKIGREVLVDVSLGSRTLVTPNVVGFERSQAVAALDTLGVNNRVTPRNSDVAHAGTVINQSPPPGSPIAIGEIVELIVSTGSLSHSIPMPNLEDLLYDEALLIIESEHLALRRISRMYEPGTTDVIVSSQYPLAGSQVSQDSEVLLTLKCPVSMESLGHRNFRLSVTVPKSAGTVEVRIVVQDRYETKQAYSNQHTGPTTVEQLIESWGRTTVKVFFDNIIVREETF